jgi:TonB-linked SusC/RagA family outer membrane protein
MPIFNVRQLSTCAVLFALLIGAVEPAQAQQGTISGTVLDRTTQAAVAGARVIIAETNRGTLTSRDGRFTLTGLAAGTYDIVVAIIGYGAATQQVVLGDGETARIDFTLVPVAVSLDALVVTATGEQRAKEVGNVVGTIQTTQITEQAPIQDMAALLTNRLPSVTVLPSAGTSGAGARVRIRGQASVSLSNEPIYYLDGVRMESGSNSLSVGTGGQSFSRINDINPEEIESIDVVKGPSAATLYGTQAANGVVRITTRRGIAGRPRWNFYSEYGVINDNNTYPDNVFGWGTTLVPSGTVPAGVIRQCFNLSAAAGSCRQDSVTSFNVLQNQRTSFFGTGTRGQLGGQVSGGSETVQYYVSGEYEREMGHYQMPDSEVGRLVVERGLDSRDQVPTEQQRPNQVERISLRTNVNAGLGSKADVQASVGLVLTDSRLPQNDNNVTGMLPSGLFGKGFEGTRTAPDTFAGRNLGSEWGFSLPGEVFAVLVNQNITRATGGLNATWRPTPRITARAVVGIDHTSRVDELLQRRDEGPAFSTFRRGRRQDNRFNIDQITADLQGAGTYAMGPRFTGKTSVGVQYLRDHSFAVNAQGLELTPGGETTGAGTIQTTSEATVDAATLGAYVEQMVGWEDRRFFTAALRLDDNSAFGKDFKAVWYPKVQASWVLSEEAFYPQGFGVQGLRLRAAYGAAGQQPGTTDAATFLVPATAALAGVDVAGLIVGALGNDELKPERSNELELGFDADFMNRRAHLEFTYYNKKSDDALVQRQIPPSLGGPASRWENIGSVRNYGIEGSLAFTLNPTASVGIDVGLIGSHNTNELLTLGEGVSPIIAGEQRHVPGYPLYGYWARPLLGFDDRDADGIIEYNSVDSLNEVFVGDTAEFLGYSIPRTTLGLNLGVTLFNNRLRVGGLLDYRAGFKQFNLTEYFRCTSSAANNCAAINDPDAPLDQQARAVAGRTPALGNTQAGYMEDASFLKLRELSFTFFAPEPWARSVRASHMSFTVTGRNLLTSTSYTGVDPEVNQIGQSDFARDFLTQPPVTYWTFRLNLGF